jgi:allantoicase
VIDLADRTLGGSVVWAGDEFFAGAENLITSTPAVHDTAAYGLRGKVYDGWETRRHRSGDAAVVRLAVPGIVRSAVVDTAFFTGNYPPFASVEGAFGADDADVADPDGWFPLVPKSALAGDTANTFTVDGPERLVSHVRLSIYPDGGVARLRVLGDVVPDPRWLGGRVDLAAAVVGGRILDCSNLFYASPANVLMPGRAAVMSDGWETARRRDDGNDWLVVELAAPGVLHHAVIDTSRFVGNAPSAAALSDADTGTVLLARTPLRPDTRHRFRVRDTEVRRVRLDIYPDGGISRLRLHGSVPPSAQDEIIQRWQALLPPDHPFEEYFT